VKKANFFLKKVKGKTKNLENFWGGGIGENL